MKDFDFNNAPVPQSNSNKREKIDWDALFFVPSKGSNRIRIVSMAGKESKVCWTTYNNSKKKVSVRCPQTGNPLQIAGRPIETHYLLKIIDRKTNTIKLYEFKSQVKNQIAALIKSLKDNSATANDSLTQYEINIERGPEGSNPLYFLTLLGKNKLETTKEKYENEVDQELLAKDKLVIEEYIKPWSVKRINEQILGLDENGKPLQSGSNPSSPEASSSSVDNTNFDFGANVSTSSKSEAKVAVASGPAKSSGAIDASDSDFLETL